MYQVGINKGIILRCTAYQISRCNPVTEFIIPKFIEGSTCFERHTAHHQELQTVFAASGLYTLPDQPFLT